MVDSPFVEGTHLQWAWDATSLGWFKECPRKYQYSMIEGWRTKSEVARLQFGIYYHKALETYDRYRVVQEHDEALRHVISDLLRWTWRDGAPWRASRSLDAEDKLSVLCRENLVRSVVWYCDRFKDDPAKTRVLADGTPMVELHFLFELGRHPYDSVKGKTYNKSYSLCGYLDRVVTFNGDPYVMDRKTTTSTISSYYYDRYDPDNQMSLYTVASQIAFHTPVKGVILDAAQVAVGFSRFGRSIIFKTADQLEEWLRDLNYWLDQAERYAEHGYWPQNDKACNNYGGCMFKEICSKSPSVRSKFLSTAFDRKPWNPLEPRGADTQ